MTSEKLKPTPGPWVVEVDDSHENWAHYFPVITAPDYGVVGTEGMFGDREQDLANARLIAEAGTVHHECGLSPRELLEGYRELRGALSLFHLDSPNMTLADLLNTQKTTRLRCDESQFS